MNYDFIQTIEQTLSKKAIFDYLPMRLVDVKRTYSDISELQKDFGYEPKVEISEGINIFVDWYKQLLMKSH